MIEKRFGNNNELSWIIIHSEREMIDKQLVEDYGLDKELVSYALDKNEWAQFENNVKLDR